MTHTKNGWQPATTCEGLQRDNILQEILDNIDSYVHGFEGVNLAPLKHDVLKKVLDGEFNPEIQIRGLLKTFHHTHEFKAALDQIHSHDLKNKITRFVEGDAADEVVHASGFDPVQHPSPSTIHHFSLLESLKKLVVKTERTIHRVEGDVHDALRGDSPDSVEITQAILEQEHSKHFKNLPLLFEDERQQECMNVRNKALGPYLEQSLIDTGVLQCPFRKLGSDRSQYTKIHILAHNRGWRAKCRWFCLQEWVPCSLRRLPTQLELNICSRQ